jgi:hypothetical protein
VEVVESVACDGQHPRLATRLQDLCCECVRVAVDDGTMSVGIADLAQLVSGRKDRDAGSLEDAHRRMPLGGEQADLTRADELTARESQRSASEVGRAPANVRRALGHRFERNTRLARGAVLLDDDRVGARRQRATGVDARGAAREQLRWQGATRPRLALDGEGPIECQVRVTDGVTIHGAVVEGR